MLLEEFKLELIESSHYTIEKCVEFVINQLEFRDKVLDEYHALGMNILVDKSNVMRALSTKFEKKEMQKVIDDMHKFINEYTEHMSVEEAIAMTKNKKKPKYDSGKRKLMDNLRKEFGNGS